MIYKSFTPSLMVQEYVKNYHLLHFDLKGLTINPTKSYFPRAEQCLTFDLRGQLTSVNKHTGEKQYRPSSYFSQQQISTYELSFDEEYIMLKVVFQPGALYRLLGIPLYELGERYVDATLLIPSEIKLVNEQLANAGTYDQMICIIEQYLVHKIKKVSLPQHRIDVINELFHQPSSRFSLDTLTRQAYLSSRQLERKYLERIGVSPIVYHRIIRFNHAIQLKEKHPALSWLAVAINCGYTDLQHLIKDFRQFSGITPSALIQEEANSIHRKLKLE
jgi:AraC-like DNA-binding protein